MRTAWANAMHEIARAYTRKTIGLCIIIKCQHDATVC